MFTGLVEVIGTVISFDPLDKSTAGGGGTSLTVDGGKDILTGAQLGDSICINGTCLTVTSLPTPTTFTVGISPETLRRTNLGSLAQQGKVNLERALLPTTRMGGHYLQGHVDTIATIASKRADGNAITFRLAPREKDILTYVVEKGYVALDGASLTVTTVNDEEGWFEIMLIAYSQEKVVMTSKAEGADVNVEVDMVGKYVEKNVETSVAAYFEGEKGSDRIASLEKMIERVVERQLAKR